MTVKTLVELFDRVLAHPRPDLLLSRSGGGCQSLSTAEFGRRVRLLCLALVRMGVEPGDRVALLSENRPEWQIADFAIQNAGGVSVPIYPTSPAAQVRYMLDDSGAKVCLVSTPTQLGKVIDPTGGPAGASAIVFDAGLPSGPRVAVSEQLAGEAIPLEEAYRRGEEAERADPSLFERRRETVRPDSLASIIYTSGTTGDPKGVMLTHSNFISNVLAVAQLVPIGPEDVTLSFLPLSHAFERIVECVYMHQGCSIAYAASMDTVPQDIQDIRPTIVAAVPRFFEKFQSRVLETVRSGTAFRRSLFHWAIDKGRRRLEHLSSGRRMPAVLAFQWLIAERLVFSPFRVRLGGRLRFFISGGAPLPREVAEFFLSAGILILEGYGLTETSPVISVNTPDRLRLGTVGPVIPGVSVRIAGDGEVLVRGENVMKGYWNRPEATAEAMSDGWFHTGDIGRLDPDGFLTITDRKKDLIITSAGKNIAPQPIENALRTSRFIANALCVGDRRKYIAALIVPELDALRAWARERGLTSGEPPASLLARPEVQALYRQEIDRATEGFAPYEKVKRFALLERDFTLDAGEITPTLKVKRRVVNGKYADLIESLY